MNQLRLQDAHLHLQDARLLENVDTLMHEAMAVGVTTMVVNGTSPADWPHVSALAHDYPDIVIPSFGLHPWHTPQPDDSWKELLVEFLDRHPAACIGECGLDRWVQNPDKEAQEDAFRFQLALATERNLPISIHVLKAWGWLLEILSSSPLPARGFMLHSFGGSKELATQLEKQGAYFSFSGYFLQSRKAHVQDAFCTISAERILIETDAPDMLPPTAWTSHPLENKLNHPANLAGILAGFAEIRDTPIDALAAQLEENFLRYFVT